MLRIKSKKEGFRRCGVAHSKQWTEHPDDRFTAAELAQIKADPMLTVEVVEDDGKIAETPPLDEMTVAQLRDLLVKLEIEIPAGSKKADLIALVMENTAEPPAED